MKIICISGKAQNGKDATAKLLEEALGGEYKVLIVHYADLLKYICRQFFGWDGQKNDTGRTLLQYVGTDVIRKKCPEYWVEFVVSVLKLFPGKWDYVIIPDCRFPNEIETMRESGFDVTHVRVVRDGFLSPLTEEQQKHPSETALDDFPVDYIIHNDGTIGALREKVFEFLSELNGYHKITIGEALKWEKVFQWQS